MQMQPWMLPAQAVFCSRPASSREKMSKEERNNTGVPQHRKLLLAPEHAAASHSCRGNAPAAPEMLPPGPLLLDTESRRGESRELPA